jgi:hypothetical protein
MCWHAHLLNPAQFAVDSDGTYAWLHALPFPLAAAAAAVRAGSLPAELPHVSHHVDRPCPTIGGWSPPDISAAVQRLARRIHQLADLGWLEPAYITGDAAPIQAGIVRYHAWLDLMAAIPDHRFVAPASDIMLSWATHATHGARFLRDTARISGDDEPLDRPIDRAEQDHEAIKRASILWRARFRHEYVHRRAPVRRSTV